MNAKLPDLKLPDGKPDAKLPELGSALVRASTLLRRDGSAAPVHDASAHGAEAWPPPGHVFELTGDFTAATTSSAVAAVADVQRQGGIVAWVQPRDGMLFPPDLAANGVDLDALAVVHLPTPRSPANGARGPSDSPTARTDANAAPPRSSEPPDASPANPDPALTSAARMRSHGADHAVPQAAELLLRSGAFDLLVLDLRPTPPRRGAWLGRLQALAREHRTRVLLLTDAHAPLVFATGLAQRLQARRRRDGEHFVVEPTVLRDKLHRGDLPPPQSRRGPLGL